MEDMDFTKPQPEPAAAAPFKPANSRFYDASAARAIFEAGGKAERFAAGQPLFLEDEKVSRGGLFRAGSRMYYLASGEVALTVGGRTLDVVKAGEIVGEMAVITGAPRTASATARSDCEAFSMDARELEAALGRNPEFALMLASAMYDRLRFLAARLATRKALGAAMVNEVAMFEPALLAQFEAALPRASTVRHWGGTVIMREGQSGAFMYVVKNGRVVITIRDKPVEVVNRGGAFGEMAVVDQSPRNATATADGEVELLQVDRPSFLAAVKSNPAFGMALLKGAAERLRHLNAMLV